jgi:hypothetical protein
LLKLTEKVDFESSDSHIQPITLPENNQNIDNGFQCITIGWGMNKSKAFINRNKL